MTQADLIGETVEDRCPACAKKLMVDIGASVFGREEHPGRGSCGPGTTGGSVSTSSLRRLATQLHKQQQDGYQPRFQQQHARIRSALAALASTAREEIAARTLAAGQDSDAPAAAVWWALSRVASRATGDELGKLEECLAALSPRDRAVVCSALGQVARVDLPRRQVWLAARNLGYAIDGTTDGRR